MSKLYKAITALFLLLSLGANAQECDVIYVTPTGSGAGTKASPAGFPQALTLVTPTANRIWMAAGTYNISNTVQLISNVTIEGGFDATTWVKSNGTPTIINRDASNPIPTDVPNAFALGAFVGQSLSNFRLQDLTINVANAPGPYISVYGIVLGACSNYNIVRVTVNTGNGAPGVAGAPGVLGTPGTAGGNGVAAGNESMPPYNAPGGLPGGGAGGNRGRWASGNTTGNGQPGSCGAAGGNSGTGAGCGCGIFGTSNNNNCSGNNPTVGAAGTSGGAR